MLIFHDLEDDNTLKLFDFDDVLGRNTDEIMIIRKIFFNHSLLSLVLLHSDL